MNKTVELVNEWAKYEQKYREGTIEEFCRHYLISQREKKAIGQNFKGVIPPEVNAYLAKLLGIIFRIMDVYIDAAVESISDLKRPEDFYIINTIYNEGESRKTDIINTHFLELSSGIDIINRLVANELLKERIDVNDKRSKLLKITEKGERVLKECYKQFSRVGEITFWEMSVDDKKLCIQLLRGVELKHARLAQEMKGKSLDEIHERVTGVKIKRK